MGCGAKHSGRYVALGFAALCLQWTSCTVDEIDLTGKKCPCADGWVCDGETGRCARPITSAGGSGGGTDASLDATSDQSSDAPSDGSGGSAAVVLGRACIGSQRSSAMAANRKRVSRFSLFSEQTFDAVMLYVETAGSASTQQMRGIVYSVGTNGQPDALVDKTAEASFPGNLAPGWVSMAFVTPLTLEPGEYWLGIHTGPAGSVAKYSFEAAPAAARFSDDTFSDGTSATFGATTNGDVLISVYARPAGVTIDDTKPCPQGTGGTGGSGGTSAGGSGGTSAGGSGGTSAGGSGGTSAGGSGGTSAGGSGGTSAGGSGGTSAGGNGGTSTGGLGGVAGAGGTGGAADASVD